MQITECPAIILLWIVSLARYSAGIGPYGEGKTLLLSLFNRHLTQVNNLKSMFLMVL